MKKMKSFSALITFLFLTSIGLSNTSAEGAGVLGKTYKLGTLNKVEVKNHQGEKLGEIEDFIMDAQSGRIVLAVLSHAGLAGMGQKVKIIPFALLFFDEREKIFLLNIRKEDLTSAILVKNLKGEDLGKIEDLVINAQGMIAFVILSHKKKSVIVPYAALSMDQAGRFFVLDASEEKLASVPPFGEDSISQSQAEKIYRYFGLRPSWTFDEAEKPALPLAIPLQKF